MKYVILFSFFVGCSSLGIAQYMVDFNSGFPSDWTQTSGADFLWTANATQGTDGSGCAMVDQGESGEAGKAKFETPFFDLSGQTGSELTLNFARVRNNFMIPDVVVWYNTGGEWIQLATTFEDPEASNSNDFMPPLESISWDTMTISLASLQTETHIQFMVEADFLNGGWILIDNFSIDGTISTVGSEEIVSENLLVYPNPTNDKLFISRHLPVQSMSIHDSSGRLVASPAVVPHELSIDVSHLGAGCYFLTVVTATGNHRVSFVVEE